MKILLLTQYFPPEFGAAAARNSEHAAIWAAAGHQVQVCTGMPNYPSGQVSAAYQGKAFVREPCDGYEVVRTWIYATPNRVVWKRALASLSFMASALLSGWLRCRRPDVIIASSGPFFVGPLGYLLSVLHRRPFVFEVRDILPQQAVDVGMLKNPLLIRTLEAIEAFLYRRAARVVTVAEASRLSLAERGVDPAKLATIENGIRQDFFRPGPKENEVRREHGWQGKFVAMYVGAHGVSQGLFTLLDVADSCRGLDDLKIVLVGEGADKPALMEAAKARGLSNVEFLPLQPKERMPGLYAAADVCFVPLRKGPYFTINIPSKTFEIMACARPVLMGAEGQAKAIVENSGGGLAIPPEDVESFSESLRMLYDDPDLCAQLAAQGRAFVLESFTRQRKAETYLALLESIVQ